MYSRDISMYMQNSHTLVMSPKEKQLIKWSSVNFTSFQGKIKLLMTLSTQQH